jgi:hypothetical protein
LFYVFVSVLDLALGDDPEPEIASGMILHHQSLVRNKRCGLVYQ